MDYTQCLNSPHQIRAGYEVPTPSSGEDSVPQTIQLILPPNPLLPLPSAIPPTVHTLYILAFEYVATTDDANGYWEVTYTSCKPPQ